MEREVLTAFYYKLVCILPVESILYKLVSAKIITTDDIKVINHMSRSKDKASFILEYIDRSLEASITESFYVLLRLMEECDHSPVKVLVRDIKQNIRSKQ